MTSNLLRSLRFVRDYRWYAVLGVLAVLAATAADLVGPQILRRIIDQGISNSDTKVIFTGAVGLVAVAIFGGLASFLQGYFSAKASHGSAYQMRDTIFDKLQRLSFSYHDRAQTGQLITRVTSDVDQVRDFVGGGLVQAVSAVLMLVRRCGAALQDECGARHPGVRRGTRDRTRARGLRAPPRADVSRPAGQARRRSTRCCRRTSPACASFGRSRASPSRAARYDVANRDLLDQGLQVRRTVANAFPLLFSVGTIGVGLVTWVGAVQIVRGTLTVGELVAFTSYLFLLLQPLFVLGFGAQQIARAGASADRLFEILDAPEDVAETPDAPAAPATGRPSRVPRRSPALPGRRRRDALGGRASSSSPTRRSPSSARPARARRASST